MGDRRARWEIRDKRWELGNRRCEIGEWKTDEFILMFYFNF